MKRDFYIRRPELLQFESETATLYGPDQEWYGQPWKRQAGCGPTCCSSVLWYLAKTRKSCAGLLEPDWHGRDGMQRLMDSIWDYVTPGGMGVNSTDIFTKGATRYGADRGVSLICDVLSIPRIGGRVGADRITEFLTESFDADIPVAFLNLSNGRENRVDSWHWVVLTGFNGENGFFQMYDQSKCVEIDLSLWLETTLLGGGFVAINTDGRKQ